jgi:hypothetical protein
MIPYLELCERWWQSWLAGEARASAQIRARYDLDAAPEPYIPFKPGENPLVVLTTNPGATMPHQLRDRILAGQSVLTPTMRYAEAADALSRFYVANLTGAAALRIAAQRALASKVGYTGVFQVECCPWHSAQTPGKAEIVKLLTADAVLSEYIQALSGFMAPRSVLVISAVSSRADLSTPDLPLSPWLQWQRDLIGMRQSDAEMVPLVWKGERVTSAALVDRTGAAVKVLLLMQGGNHLPGPHGRAILAAALGTA